MARRTSVLAAWIGFLVLLALHLDFWRAQRTTVHLGWIPEEMLYRLGWMALAWLYLLFVCGRIWREREPDGSGEEEDAA